MARPALPAPSSNWSPRCPPTASPSSTATTPIVSQFGRDFHGRVVYFGAGPCADPQILDVREDLDGLHVHFRAGEREGDPHASACSAATTPPTPWPASPSLLKRASNSTPPSPRSQTLTAGDKRGEVIEIDGATILNDSYNSNPEALRSMIRTLAARPASRRILVAGEMLELGEHGPELHAACGRAAAEAGLDLVVGVQGNAVHLAAAACAGGVASLFLPDAEAAGRWLETNSASRRRGPRQRLARRPSRAGHRSRRRQLLRPRANDLHVNRSIAKPDLSPN